MARTNICKTLTNVSNIIVYGFIIDQCAKYYYDKTMRNLVMNSQQKQWNICLEMAKIRSENPKSHELEPKLYDEFLNEKLIVKTELEKNFLFYSLTLLYGKNYNIQVRVIGGDILFSQYERQIKYTNFGNKTFVI
jgi:hypothetical protein